MDEESPGDTDEELDEEPERNEREERIRRGHIARAVARETVSYTHLTLPTIYSV